MALSFCSDGLWKKSGHQYRCARSQSVDSRWFRSDLRTPDQYICGISSEIQIVSTTPGFKSTIFIYTPKSSKITVYIYIHGCIYIHLGFLIIFMTEIHWIWWFRIGNKCFRNNAFNKDSFTILDKWYNSSFPDLSMRSEHDSHAY